MGGTRKLEVRDKRKRGRKPGWPRMASGYAGAVNEGPMQAQQNRRNRAYVLIVNKTDRKR